MSASWWIEAPLPLGPSSTWEVESYGYTPDPSVVKGIRKVFAGNSGFGVSRGVLSVQFDINSDGGLTAEARIFDDESDSVIELFSYNDVDGSLVVNDSVEYASFINELTAVCVR